MKILFVLVAFTLITTHAHASKVFSEKEVRDIATRALEAYNVDARKHGYSEERLFEGYAKLEATQCEDKGEMTECTFSVTEKSDRDEAVYTPNLLHVQIENKTNKIKVDLEMGC